MTDTPVDKSETILDACLHHMANFPGDVAAKLAELMVIMQAIKDERNQLRLQLTAAEKDAARYRFIREVPYTDDIRQIMWLQKNAIMDSAIDAAMEKARG